MPPKNANRSTSDPVGARVSEIPKGSAALVNDPEAEAEMKTSTGLSRMVDMRIPLWQVLVALVAGGFTLISMWFSLQQLTDAMRKVQATLEASTAQTQTFREELAVQKFRLANIEAEIATFKAIRLRTP